MAQAMLDQLVRPVGPPKEENPKINLKKAQKIVKPPPKQEGYSAEALLVYCCRNNYCGLDKIKKNRWGRWIMSISLCDKCVHVNERMINALADNK